MKNSRFAPHFESATSRRFRRVTRKIAELAVLLKRSPPADMTIHRILQQADPLRVDIGRLGASELLRLRQALMRHVRD